MGKLLAGLGLGILLGGGAAAVVFWLVLQAAERRHQEELAALGLNQGMNLAKNFLQGGGQAPVPAKAPVTEQTKEKALMELAKSYIEDLEKRRLLRVYRATTDEYQKKNERKVFEDMIDKNKELSNLQGEGYDSRQFRLNKKAGGKGYDFYFTDAEKSSLGRKLVNISMTLVEEEADWRIADIDITIFMKGG